MIMKPQPPVFYAESPRHRRVRILFFYLISLSLLVALFLSGRAIVRFAAQKSNDSSNLRQIVQSVLIHSLDHNGNLPRAPDIWSYAHLLSASGLEASSLWQSRIDPAYKNQKNNYVLISTPQTKDLNPAFRNLPLSFAVPQAQLTTLMSASTPVIWTRGLQPNGTWADHSPYGKTGGHITFLGGNITYFKNLSDAGGQLARFDGKGATANILEALPPGAQIIEYQPTPSEKKAWAKTNWFRAAVHNLVTPWSFGICFLSIIIIPGIGHSRHSLKVGIRPLVAILTVLVIFASTIACITR
jgi:hypothetical protein